MLCACLLYSNPVSTARRSRPRPNPLRRGVGGRGRRDPVGGGGGGAVRHPLRTALSARLRRGRPAHHRVPRARTLVPPTTALHRCAVNIQSSPLPPSLSTFLSNHSNLPLTYRDSFISPRLSLKPHGQTLPTFLRQLPVVVARSSFGGVSICYLLPVLWLTSWPGINDTKSAYLQVTRQVAAHA